MGMYCCCGQKIRNDGEWVCLCDWAGWVSTCDYPKERNNKGTPISLPKEDGSYLCRVTNSGDRYEEILSFSLVPCESYGGYIGCKKYLVHWEGESWEEGTPYAWKPLTFTKTLEEIEKVE